MIIAILLSYRALLGNFQHFDDLFWTVVCVTNGIEIFVNMKTVSIHLEKGQSCPVICNVRSF